jgi:hypothetical protein
MRRITHHLKHWLIPHKHNDHRPHLIRAHGLAIIVALIVVSQASAYALRPAGSITVHTGKVLDYATGSITPDELLTLTNQDRAANGIAPLTMNAKLNNSAAMKAANMFAESYWAHVSRSCLQPWYWFTKAGYDYAYAGENLAQGFDDSAGVNTGWMNSPGHRANILNPHYTDVGFAVENGNLPQTVTPDCSWEQQPTLQTTLVVAHYGSQVATASAPAVPQTPAVASASTPQATPAATPVPTPAPTPAPSVSPSPTAHVAPATSTQRPLTQPNLFAPATLVATIPPGTLATIIVLLILLIVYAATHFTVWRKGLRRWHKPRYKLYAATQIGGLILVIGYLATLGIGQVG